MTFLDLQNLTAYWLDDLQFGYFTQPQVKLWLNNAQREVQKRLIKAAQNYYNRCVQTTLIPNQTDYVLPQDFKKLMRLEIVVSGVAPNEAKYPLEPITTMQQDMVPGGVGPPAVYRFNRSRIIIQPAPQIAQVMRMVYAYEVADMVLDTDTPDVPDSYSELLALLAAEDGLIKDGRESALLEKKIASYQRDLDADAQERNEDTTRRIRETDSDSGGFYW